MTHVRGLDSIPTGEYRVSPAKQAAIADPEAVSSRLGMPLKNADGSDAPLKMALDNLASGKVVWLVSSGKMAAGKDSLSSQIKLPSEVTMLSYGNVLRNQLKPLLPVIRSHSEGLLSREETVRIVAQELGYTNKSASELVDATLAEQKVDPNVTGYSRTDGMRTLLQNMGGDWMPTKDSLAFAAAREAVHHLAEGRSVLVTGGRMLPDVEIPEMTGAMTLRIQVNRETQIRRLRGRDGLALTPEMEAALNHCTETELDNYDFLLTVNNDKDGAEKETVRAMQAAVNSQVYARRARTAR